jgi:iron complex transport system ATP-binding protein
MSMPRADASVLPGIVRLRLEEVGFWRADARILREIDWEVRTGEHWAILGPNGSGKTTLVMIATGYQPSSAGRVFVIDGYISEIVLPRVRERVALASAALSETMLERRRHTTGLEVVLSGRYASLGLFAAPPPAAVARAREILAQLGGERLAEVPFARMSTGQRQLCMLGRCQMADSLLVILDEPCAGLDLAAREALLAAIGRGCDSVATPQVLVTHHPEEIVAGITHVLLLREGAIVAQGPRAAVLNEENLSRTFGLRLRVLHEAGRVWVIPQS